MGRRTSRYDRLFKSNAEAIIRDGLRLRETVLAAQLHLKASGSLFWQLNGLTDKLHDS
ncbi:hypothetical protein [Mesorhizobium sp. ES1-3]|uniref:hypothetical protein n=1 Tax=Mesorhizobium sp. ES1-3 TaxID=2876628 RepID=UPI001CCD2EC8|nr:hypothetical protein [Mesorhizobium sp. ES1-3]